MVGLDEVGDFWLDLVRLNLSGINKVLVGIVDNCDDALLYIRGDRMGEVVGFVDVRQAIGLEFGRGAVPVLPNPPVPLSVSEITEVVVMSG